MPWQKSVYSSNVSSIEYDDQTQEMTIYFTRGVPYVYEGVPEGEALALASAPSVGGMLNASFKGAYPYRRK